MFRISKIEEEEGMRSHYVGDLYSRQQRTATIPLLIYEKHPNTIVVQQELRVFVTGD